MATNNSKEVGEFLGVLSPRHGHYWAGKGQRDISDSVHNGGEGPFPQTVYPPIPPVLPPDIPEYKVTPNPAKQFSWLAASLLAGVAPGSGGGDGFFNELAQARPYTRAFAAGEGKGYGSWHPFLMAWANLRCAYVTTNPVVPLA